MKTQVAIIGAGPAGLLLGHLLRAEGVDCVILERQSRAYIEGRIRAGVLETITTDLLHRLGIDAGLNAHGMMEEGFNLADSGRMIRIPITELTGQHVVVYGQTEVTRDLIDAAPERGLEIVFEAADVALHDIDGPPYVTYEKDGVQHQVYADFIAGCDGFHGPSRQAIPHNAIQEHQIIYPWGWLGILAEAPRSFHELIYSRHDRGFALLSTRSPTVQRIYVQCDPHDAIEAWPDHRIWQEMQARFAFPGWTLSEGPIFQKGIVGMRSYVCDPMQYGRLFIAGDAAHIVPPTGAKGLNLAVADVLVLSRALDAWYKKKDRSGLDCYSANVLPRIWKCERFSWFMTTMLHQNPADSSFERHMRLAELDTVVGSCAAATALAEIYVGLPLD